MKPFTVVLTAVLVVACSSTANADLILKLIGTNGSAAMNYEASGSVTITTAITSVNSSLGLAPLSTGNYTSSFDNNLGDFLKDSMNGTFNDDLVLSNGGVSYRRNGTEFGVLDTLDLDGAVGGGNDDVELDPTASINYPSLLVGDILSWTGSGTFTLEDGETFDTLFTTTGKFSNSIDGGQYSVIIQNSAVPEPSSLILMASGLAGYVVVRRRKKKQLETEAPENAEV